MKQKTVFIMIRQTAVQPVTSLSATELLQVQQTQPVKLSSAAMIAAAAVNKKININQKRLLGNYLERAVNFLKIEKFKNHFTHIFFIADIIESDLLVFKICKRSRNISTCYFIKLINHFKFIKFRSFSILNS